LQFLKQAFDQVLSIFPFEDPSFHYVGNPLIDELPLGLTQNEARKTLGIPMEKSPVLLLMPGSRPAELSMHSKIMVDAAKVVKGRFLKEGRGELRIHVALPEISDASAEQVFSDLGVSVSRGDAATWLKASDAALVKSGTSTLEAALLDCPHALVYKTSVLSAFLFRNLVRFKGPVGLVNLLLAYDPCKPDFFRSSEAPRVTREIVLDEVTVASLSDEAYSLLTDEKKRQTLHQAFQRLKTLLRAGGESPSLNAAARVLQP
jgi:lipid-A-disaccharide synthase